MEKNKNSKNYDEMSREEKIFELTDKIMIQLKDMLYVQMGFLDLAMNALKTQADSETDTVATDGSKLFYNPNHIVRLFKEKAHGESLINMYLHVIMHCVFKHMFVSPTINGEFWDLACDMAVWGVINDLKSEQGWLNTPDSVLSNEFFAVTAKAKGETAEKIYSYLMDGKLSLRETDRLKKLFGYDDHYLWYIASGDGEAESEEDSEAGEAGEAGEDGGNGNVKDSGGADGFNRAETEKLWSEIAQRMQIEIETFLAKKQGNGRGNLVQNLKEVNREKYDYASFLKKFAVNTEAMKINDDEFDYVFYTYGLSLYKNMPLVEPLEYKDVKRIREFAVAIDTSGSTSGELVQTFVQKTYNILKSTESFDSKINLHIIQCDADIQEDVKITSQEEFDEYLKNMKIRGLGGTDFRPVFEYVNELREKGELTHLKGLIYFTDGCGEFPKQMPEYDTAFVFIDDEYNNYDVPSWAIKLILKREEV